MKIFGFQIGLSNDNEKQDDLPSIAPAIVPDGSLTVAAGGSYGTVIDLDGTVNNDALLITKYRDMALHPEIDSAITDIINEMIIFDPEKNSIVEINLDHVDELDDNVKRIIENEFAEILRLLHFNIQAHDVARRNYVDGRMYWHVIVDPNNPLLGIQELRYLDPRKIKKIREVTNVPLNQNSIAGAETIQKVRQEYYIYNEKGFMNSDPSKMNNATSTATTGIRISPDAIIHITSGMTDAQGKLVLSHLHKAIKPLNMLRSIEDAALIYRLARAPDRRIFYIDVGDMPLAKQEQYLRNVMANYRNRLVYDAATGEVKDERKHMTLLEDFWFPRRGNGQTTQVDTLPGGQSVGVIEEMEYFKAMLYQSLNVPYSRTNPDQAYSLGRATEISRDEVKFAKFIDRLQMKFNDLFIKILRVQLALRQIMAPDQFDFIKYKIKFKYSKDNLFEEMKQAELRDSRMTQLQIADQYVGVYFSHKWIKKMILMQNDREIAEIEQDNEIEQEMLAIRREQEMIQNGIDPDNPGGAPPDDGEDGPPSNGGGSSKKGKSINKKKSSKKPAKKKAAKK